MRQPVCVGCDGRELLTLNSVTAPLTEPHLNGHKTSPEDLRNSSSVWGGTRGGGQPRKAAKTGLHAEERTSQAQKPGQCWECRGAPPVGAVPALPRHKRSIRRDPEPRAMGSGALNSTQNLCAKGWFWCSNPENALQAWEWVHGLDIHVFCWGRGGSRVPRSPARELLPPDNLGHCLKAKGAAKTGACNKKTSGWKQPAWEVPRARNHSLKLFWYALDQAMHPLFAWETTQNTEKTRRQWHKHTVNTILLLSWEQTNRICRA